MPWPNATSAVRNRTVVPLLATYKSAKWAGIRPPHPVTCKISLIESLVDRDAQGRQRLDHHARVFAVERAAQRRRAFGQRGADQGAVGQTLGSRRPDRRVDRGQDGLNLDALGHVAWPVSADWRIGCEAIRTHGGVGAIKGPRSSTGVCRCAHRVLHRQWPASFETRLRAVPCPPARRGFRRR